MRAASPPPTIVVRRADAGAPEAKALLEAYWAYIASHFSAAENFALDLEALRQPEVTFFMATIDGRAVGCAALARPKRETVGDLHWVELKSMYVAEWGRGGGVADALLDAVEAEARAEDADALYLETGDVLEPARRFYQRRGFVIRGAYGGYPALPELVFMEKSLSAPASDGAKDAQ